MKGSNDATMKQPGLDDIHVQITKKKSVPCKLK